MTVHSERRVIPHSPEDLYALVADVRRYPEFLPWCLAARIRQADEHALSADLIIGFRMFRERFTSYVELNPDQLEIEVKYAEGPFKYLTNSCIHIKPILNKYLSITMTNVKITIIKRDQEKNFPRIMLVLFINCKYFIFLVYFIKILSIKLLLVNGNILSIEIANLVKK